MQIWSKIETDPEYSIPENIMFNSANKEKFEEMIQEKTNKLFNWVITSETCGSYPNVKVLFLIAMIFPLISSDAERLFSLSSLIHDAIRNQLLVQHVYKLIVVHMSGGEISKFDPIRILKWYVVEKGKTNL
jgi:hypothetical protein